METGKKLNPFELKMQEEKARKEAERMKKKEDDKKNDPFIQKTSFESVPKPLVAPAVKKHDSVSFFKPKEEMKEKTEEVQAPPAIVKPQLGSTFVPTPKTVTEEEKKENPEIKKESKTETAEAQGEDDFKKSLAAMIGRGKPKRSTVAVKAP